MIKYNSWKPKEDKLLTKLRKDGLNPLKIKELEYLEGRTINAVRSRCQILDITDDRKGLWTNKEYWKMWILIKKGYYTEDISKEIGRSKTTTGNRISNMGLFYHPPSGEPPEELKEEVNKILGENSK